MRKRLWSSMKLTSQGVLFVNVLLRPFLYLYIHFYSCLLLYCSFGPQFTCLLFRSIWDNYAITHTKIIEISLNWLCNRNNIKKNSLTTGPTFNETPVLSSITYILHTNKQRRHHSSNKQNHSSIKFRVTHDCFYNYDAHSVYCDRQVRGFSPGCRFTYHRNIHNQSPVSYTHLTLPTKA